jgi:hypothetical protein
VAFKFQGFKLDWDVQRVVFRSLSAYIPVQHAWKEEIDSDETAIRDNCDSMCRVVEELCKS